MLISTRHGTTLELWKSAEIRAISCVSFAQGGWGSSVLLRWRPLNPVQPRSWDAVQVYKTKLGETGCMQRGRRKGHRWRAIGTLMKMRRQQVCACGKVTVLPLTSARSRPGIHRLTAPALVRPTSLSAVSHVEHQTPIRCQHGIGTGGLPVQVGRGSRRGLVRPTPVLVSSRPSTCTPSPRLCTGSSPSAWMEGTWCGGTVLGSSSEGGVIAIPHFAHPFSWPTCCPQEAEDEEKGVRYSPSLAAQLTLHAPTTPAKAKKARIVNVSNEMVPSTCMPC